MRFRPLPTGRSYNTEVTNRCRTSKEERPALALQTVAVLRIERIESLNADAAGGVDRFRIGVGADQAEARAEALGQLDAAGVVVRVGRRRSPTGLRRIAVRWAGREASS